MNPNRIARAASIAAVLLFAAAGCAPKSALPDACYAQNMVPLYPNAELKDQMGGNSYGDGPDAAWDSMAWWLQSKDDATKIVAFYDRHLRGWQKTTDENGVTTFKTLPSGADQGEEVYVIVRTNGEIQIGESVKSSKKKHTES